MRSINICTGKVGEPAKLLKNSTTTVVRIWRQIAATSVGWYSGVCVLEVVFGADVMDVTSPFCLRCFGQIVERCVKDGASAFGSIVFKRDSWIWRRSCFDLVVGTLGCHVGSEKAVGSGW